MDWGKGFHSDYIKEKNVPGMKESMNQGMSREILQRVFATSNQEEQEQSSLLNNMVHQNSDRHDIEEVEDEGD